jgi:hypothetical protein
MDEAITLAPSDPADTFAAAMAEAVTPVRLAPLIAGSAPESLEAESPTIEASCTELTAWDEAITLAPSEPAEMLAAVRLVRLAPLMAGSEPVRLPAVRLVRFAPLIAGSAPDSLEAVTPTIEAS